MHKNTTKCNKTQSKRCINKHGASKIIDTFETYQRVAGGVAGVETSRVAGVGNCRGGPRRSVVRRRAVGGGVAGVRKCRVEDGVRWSTARRRGVGGGVVEEEVWLHRKSSHGGEDRGDGGRLGVGRRLGLRRRSESDRMCLG
jgi:hypothetical protein